MRDAKGKVMRKYLLPSGAHLMVEDGHAVSTGDVPAKIPRETAKTWSTRSRRCSVRPSASQRGSPRCGAVLEA